MKNENRQFDPQEQYMEDALSKSKALSPVDAPEGLADRVMAASAPMLDQTPALLSEATHVDSPSGLADRVMAASAPMLGSPEFQIPRRTRQKAKQTNGVGSLCLPLHRGRGSPRYRNRRRN